MSGTAKAVFISYASLDVAVANAVVEALEKAGLACWMAPRDVVPGEFYAGAIVHAIDAAKAIVLVLSGNAASSQHVLREVERASSKKHPLVSLRIDLAPLPADLEYFVNTSHWLDATSTGVGPALPKLVDAVQRAVGLGSVGDLARTNDSASLAMLPVVRPSATMKPSPRPNRAVVALITVIAVALVYVVIHQHWVLKRVSAAKPASGVPTTASVTATVAQEISDKSVAVLPFVDMSENQNQEYFADGMAEEVLDLLAKIPNVRVIARTSSFQFKGRNEDLRRIGAALGSAYVVEGSVRKSGANLRVTAQLIDVRDGSHLWSETYDESSGDVLQVQDKIAAGLVRALQVTIGADDLRSRAALRSLLGYNLYLRGRQALDRGNKEGFQEAVEFFKQALTHDPESGLVHGWLAHAYSALAINGYTTDRSFADARRSAERARALDPRSELAAGVLGLIHAMHDWDWAAAQRELDLALSLAPGNAQILQWHSVLPAALGRWEDSIHDLHTALALDPLASVTHLLLARIELRRGHWNEAEAALRRTLEIAPNSAYAHFYLAGALLGRRDAEGALREYALEHDEESRLVGRVAALHALGRHAESDAAMRQLSILAARDWPYGLACAHAARGEHDAALAWLEKAYAARAEDLWTVKGDMFLRSLSGEPRYHAFLRKMNLPE